jgi:hypothetical protein
MSTSTSKRLVAVLLAVLLITGAGLFAWPKPKLYQGKTVRQWVGLLDPHVDNQKQREEAAWVVVQIGPAALPELESILAWRPGPLESLREYAVRFHLWKPRPIPPLHLQSRACEAAYHLAERGNVDISSLVPHLQYHFTNGTYGDSSSGRALAGAGRRGFCVLTNLLFTGRPAVQDMAGWSLGHVSKRPEVVAALVQYGNDDPSLAKRVNALIYLRGCDGPAELVVLLGLKYLRSESQYAQRAAVELLQDYKQDERVREALEELRNRKPASAATTDGQERE